MFCPRSSSSASSASTFSGLSSTIRMFTRQSGISVEGSEYRRRNAKDNHEDAKARRTSAKNAKPDSFPSRQIFAPVAPSPFAFVLSRNVNRPNLPVKPNPQQRQQL